jgi:RNA polymerase I-specific transcription initiation factor RRN6
MWANAQCDRHGVGYDYIHNDADGGNMRLDVRSQVKSVQFPFIFFQGSTYEHAGV